MNATCVFSVLSHHRCSADLNLTGAVVSKVSEAYGDYSTVLASKGGRGF